MNRPPQKPAAHFRAWRDDLLSGRKPTYYRLAATGTLAELEIGPGRVVLLGGPPNVGKSALAVQLVIDALRLDPELRAVVMNVEMPPAALLDRQVSRLSGIDCSMIHRRTWLPEHRPRIDAALATLDSIADRLAFAGPPFNLNAVAAAADALDARLLLLDYVQRISATGDDDGNDRRGAVTAVMDKLREFATQGAAILAVAAVGRSKDGAGRLSYGNLSMASFRETSELEYGADDAYLLVPDEAGEVEAGDVLLRQEKSRYGERREVALRFYGRAMQFTERVRLPAETCKGLAAEVAKMLTTESKSA